MLFNPPPLKKKKNQKNHDTAVQSNILWLNLNKISEKSFYNQQINQVTPHFTFMRRVQNADTHAIKQYRLSQNSSPVGSSLVLVIASDMLLQPESEKERRTLIFTQLKISRYKQHLSLFFFLSILKNLTSDLVPVV